MRWTAIVPLKRGAEAKSRLAPRLSATERALLVNRMAAHVLACVGAARLAPRVLSPVAWPGAAWERDCGAGLNAELDRVREEHARMSLLVLHGDLPLLAPGDVAALLAAAEAHGAAIAPDRHGAGTNALALADARAFHFAFGADSFARHAAAAPHAAHVTGRPGLAFDIDTPDDLAEAKRLGWS